MRNTILPVMAVMTVVAGAVGLQLGESAIAQIDPIHFQGAAPPPRDVTKDPRPSRTPGFAEASGWAEGYGALEEDCGDCPAFASRQSYAPSPAVYTDPDPAEEPRWAEATRPMPEEDNIRIERAVQSSRLQRYLHYPVSADQEEIQRGIESREKPDVLEIFDEPVAP